MRARSLSSFVVVLVAPGLVSGQEGDKKAKADPSGTWKWERDFNGNKIDYTLRLNWKDNQLAGTYKTVFENGGPELSEPVKIDDGKIDGDAISFTVTRSFNDNEFTISYSGKIAGDKIAGSSEIDFGNGAREFEWDAQRVVTADDVAGKWNVKFERPNGAIESSFTLAKDGDNLKGTYHSTFFGDNPMKEIELKDNKLTFVVDFETDNGEFSVTYKAEPRGDKIAGVIAANFGGQDTETPFEGARAAAPKSNAGGDEE